MDFQKMSADTDQLHQVELLQLQLPRHYIDQMRAFSEVLTRSFNFPEGTILDEGEAAVFSLQLAQVALHLLRTVGSNAQVVVLEHDLDGAPFRTFKLLLPKPDSSVDERPESGS